MAVDVREASCVDCTDERRESRWPTSSCQNCANLILCQAGLLYECSICRYEPGRICMRTCRAKRRKQSIVCANSGRKLVLGPKHRSDFILGQSRVSNKGLILLYEFVTI